MRLGGLEVEVEGSAVPLSRGEARLLLELGELWLELGHFERARAVLEGAVALMPGSPVPQLALGRVAFARGEMGGALRAARTAQRLAPRSALAAAQAGEALLFEGKSREGKRELERAVALEPEGPAGNFARGLLALVQPKEG
jgi:cytochrome c-type biogenesis protein CcmH/NrfG